MGAAGASSWSFPAPSEQSSEQLGAHSPSSRHAAKTTYEWPAQRLGHALPWLGPGPEYTGELSGQTAHMISNAATKGSLQTGSLSSVSATSWGRRLTGGLVPGTDHLEKHEVKGLYEHNPCCQCTSYKCTKPRWRPVEPFPGKSFLGSCSLPSICAFIPVSHFICHPLKKLTIIFLVPQISPTDHTFSKFSPVPSFYNTYSISEVLCTAFSISFFVLALRLPWLGSKIALFNSFYPTDH